MELQTTGADYRLCMAVEYTANAALLADSERVAGHEDVIRAANARLESALDRWRTRVEPILENLRAEHLDAPAPPNRAPRWAVAPEIDPPEPGGVVPSP